MISFQGVSKQFGDIKAVNNLSFEIHQGEIFGLLGPNGAGKTSSVHMAVGLIQPDSGKITVNGGTPHDKATHARLGLATQALAIYEELSARENLMFFGRMQGLNGSNLQSRVQWALDFVSLAARQKERVKGYSGGMKRRLNLAVAVIHDPEVIILDEPTVGVDPQSRNAIFEQTMELNRQGRTVIYITHYMEEAQQLCHRVGIMDEGRLHALGTVQELIAQYGGKTKVSVVLDGEKRTVETDQPIDALKQFQTEGELTGISVDAPNLERVFLNLTGRTLRD